VPFGGARGGGAIRVPARGDGEVLLLPLLARHAGILRREVRQGQPHFVREADGRSDASRRQRRYLASRDVCADVVGWDHSHGYVQGTAVLRRLSHTGLDPHAPHRHQIVWWLRSCLARGKSNGCRRGKENTSPPKDALGWAMRDRQGVRCSSDDGEHESETAERAALAVFMQRTPSNLTHASSSPLGPHLTLD